MARVARDEPNATLEAREDLTADVATLVVRPDEPVPGFRPGQYFAIGLPVDGRFVQRPYSTATASGPADRLEFLVRRVRGGELTPALWEVPVGGRLRLGPPKGLFTLDPEDSRTHLFVATGTGLAPFISMLATLGDRPRPPSSVIVHGVARAAELAYRDSLEVGRVGAARVRYEPTVSRPFDPDNARWQGRIGRVDVALASLVPELGDPRDLVAYLCGSPGMIATAEYSLRSLGVARDAIVAERYWTTEARAA
jgi:ferredoxin--NADP+ reductase